MKTVYALNITFNNKTWKSIWYEEPNKGEKDIVKHFNKKILEAKYLTIETTTGSSVIFSEKVLEQSVIEIVFKNN